MQLLRVVDCGDKILLDLSDGIGFDARHLARVLNAKQNRPAVPVEEGTHRLVDIPGELAPARLELRRDAFPPAGSPPATDVHLRSRQFLLQSGTDLTRLLANGRPAPVPLALYSVLENKALAKRNRSTGPPLPANIIKFAT